jgi:peptide chain release factor 1
LHRSNHIFAAQVFRALKYECGVHRVQRVPVTGTKNDRLQTSTCSVAVLPLPDETHVELSERDLKFEFMRSSGAGGQSVNKTDSACRLVTDM